MRATSSAVAVIVRGGWLVYDEQHTWVGAPPATCTIRELDGVIYASVDTGCNRLTIAITLDEIHITPNAWF